MQTILAGLLQAVYIVGVLGLALYGGQAFWLTWQWFRKRTVVASAPPQPLYWPKVTVQLPIYNEHHVVERLIDACANLAYPPDRLQIQVLDDSTDQTTALALRRADHWRHQGRDVVVMHRADRTGYKAGALAHALPAAKGDYITIFDADFAPPQDFLYRVMPHFLSSAGQRIGFIQARWGHLNAAYSALTACQALALDGHFVVEQAGRQAADYPFGFNGSGGVWRRACISDPRVGGWQIDTLCEDLDLSYRAQLAGWRPLYLNDLEAPSEIPPQLAAFKRQQFRWAKGSIQTLRKLGKRVLNSGWPRPARLLALVHLGSYLIHPLLLFLLLVSLPLLFLAVDPAPHLALLSLTALGPPILYTVAQRALHPNDWWKRLLYLPLLTLFGTGLSLSNTIAVWQGLWQQGGQFLRTPKFCVEATTDRWQASSYRLPLGAIFWGELTLFFYALGAVSAALWLGKWWSAAFMALYVGGFGLMVIVGLWQAASHPGQPDSKQPRRFLGRRAVGFRHNRAGV